MLSAALALALALLPIASMASQATAQFSVGLVILPPVGTPAIATHDTQPTHASRDAALPAIQAPARLAVPASDARKPLHRMPRHRATNSH